MKGWYLTYTCFVWKYGDPLGFDISYKLVAFGVYQIC